MNSLAEATNRLCMEIVALRSDRDNLRRALQEQTMDRRVAMRERCLEWNRDRLAMGQIMGEQRHAFVNHLRRAIAGQRQEVRADLVGARAAWMGNGEGCLERGTGVTPIRKDRRSGSAH